MGYFSFLYRNERTATRNVKLGIVNFAIFQFPLSERTNCNINFCVNIHRDLRISVSSIGTNELQRKTRNPPHRVGRYFSFLYRNERTATALTHDTNEMLSDISVSSIGTNELQLVIFHGHNVRPFQFQFPLSERTNCNRASVVVTESKNSISVSSIGTNELQLKNAAR